MQGSVRKRGDTWSYRFDLGVVDGKRQQREKGGFRTKKEAEAALAKALNEYNNAGLVFDPSEITVSDYLDQWFDIYCIPNLKYNTQLGYLNIIENHLKPAFGSYKLKSLTPVIFQEYANQLKMNGYSKNHIDGILITLTEALGYAVEPLRYIAFNPMDKVKRPKVDKPPKERIILTLDEWNQILTRFEGTRFEIPLLIGFYTGVRIGEAMALTWDDIDFDARRISINHQVVKRDPDADVRKAFQKKEKKAARSAWYFQTLKTTSSNRVISIGDTLCNALREEQLRQRKNELKAGGDFMVHYLKKEKDEKGNDIYRIVPLLKCIDAQLPRVRMVCIASNGEFTSPDSMKYAARIIHHEMRLAYDFHSLRHTHATMLIEAGANIKDVQCRLGHSNISTTLNTYVHDTEQMQNRTAEIFEQVTKRKTV